MYPLIFTTAFLMIMGLFASSEMANFKMGELESRLFDNYLATQSLALTEKYQAHLDCFDAPKTKEKTIKPETFKESKKREDPFARSLNFNHNRPPNNGRLNFYLLLHEPKQSFYTENFSLYEVTANLLRTLYKEHSFFYEIPRAEYKILDALLEKKGESAAFHFADELANIDLENPLLQKIFSQMLRGGECPSLLDYITFDKGGTRFDRKINFLFASPELLSSIIRDKRVLTSLLTARDEFWVQLNAQEKNHNKILQKDAYKRNDVSKKSQFILEESLKEYGINPILFTPLFDFTLGKKGTVIYLKDPLTNIIKREKYKPKG